MEKNFSEAFSRHLRETGMTVAQVAERSGVKRDALYKLNSGDTKNMSVVDAISVSAAFGKTVEEFMGASNAQTRSELEALIAALSDRERRILLGSLKALSGDPDHQAQPHGEDDDKDDAAQRSKAS